MLLKNITNYYTNYKYTYFTIITYTSKEVDIHLIELYMLKRIETTDNKLLIPIPSGMNCRTKSRLLLGNRCVYYLNTPIFQGFRSRHCNCRPRPNPSRLRRMKSRSNRLEQTYSLIGNISFSHNWSIKIHFRLIMIFVHIFYGIIRRIQKGI